MINRYRMADPQFGPIGVAGVYGPGGPAGRRIGRAEDRRRVLGEGRGCRSVARGAGMIARRRSGGREGPEGEGTTDKHG
jgi:hypothetical protein